MISKQKIKNYFKQILLIKDDIIWNRHIAKVHKRLGINKKDIDEKLVKKHIDYWSQLKRKVNPKWFEVYFYITKNPDIRFAPENVYFGIVEDKLNNRDLVLAYADKNFYDFYYQIPNLFPTTLLRNIDGFFYDSRYNFIPVKDISLNSRLQDYEKIIVKPSVDSGGGRRIKLFKRRNNYFFDDDNNQMNLEFLKKQFGNNFLIQEYINQCTYLSKFNETSLNTIRIFTYRSVQTDIIHALHAVLRIGKKGNYLDDQNFGGVACLINEDLTLSDFATNYFGEKFAEFNGVVFAKTEKVPLVKEMKEIATMLAGKNLHSRVIGFDFTIDERNNIKLIEINHLWTGINFFQMNGAPVLGDFTDEVIEFCKINSSN